MTSLVRFDPWSITSDPWRMMRNFDRLLEDNARRSANNHWLPRVDIFDKDADLVVRVEVPGADPEHIDVTVEGGRLTITGSRGFENEEELKGGYHRKEIFEGRFKRTVLLPKGTDADAVTATTKDGILEVLIPKTPEVLPRKITVDVQR